MTFNLLSAQLKMSWAPTETHLLKHLTVFAKPFNPITFKEVIIPCYSTRINPSADALHYDGRKSQCHPPLRSQDSIRETQKKSSSEARRWNQGLKRSYFVEKYKQKNHLDPLEMLKEDGDWSKEQFWEVINFFRQSSRTSEILQVFDLWKEREKSRICGENYEKIVGIFSEEGLTEAAVSALEQMKSHGLRPSVHIFNCIIHGFARAGGFDDALFYHKQMKEIGLKPNTETYDGLIQAYGKYRMYDEMGQCLKEMEFNECSPDHITYNLLIREFAKAGLLKKMESTYQTLRSNRMDLQSSALVSMLDAYADFRILNKMERIFKRVLNSKVCLRDDLIRKLAVVYIENLMFSRLDDLGLDLSSRTGSTDLVWCLRILSHACVLSRKGMYSIIQEMESNEVPWNVTVANILSQAYLKMKDFTRLNILLSELPFRCVKPDIITVGVLLDACMIGFDGTSVKNTWRRSGFFEDKVEMNTDPLVLTAFGKGQFLRDFEEIYSSTKLKAKWERIWTYCQLIDLVITHKKTQLEGVTEIKAKQI